MIFLSQVPTTTPLPDLSWTINFLVGLLVLLVIVSSFYATDENKRPHRLVLRVLRSKRRQAQKERVLKALQTHVKGHLARCPYCGTGAPHWKRPDVLHVAGRSKNAYMLAFHTCSKCGNVQLFESNWLLDKYP